MCFRGGHVLNPLFLLRIVSGDELTYSGTCCGGAQQFVVFQAKQRHLILRIARAFPIVVPAEVKLHHLEKFRSVHHRRSEREARPRQLTLDKRDEMRCEQTRKRQLGLQPELIRIEVVATSIHLAYLPLISSVKIYSEVIGE